jgi:hypothetical protein
MKAVRSYGYPYKNRLPELLTERQISAVNQCGGWDRFCDCPTDQRGTLAAQFRRVWEDITGTERRMQNLPDGVRPRIEFDHAAAGEVKRLAEQLNLAVDR